MLRTILAFIATIAVSQFCFAQQLTFTEVPIPTPGNSIIDFAVPIHGDPLFTEFEANRIGILMSDRVVEFSIPTPSSGPTAIAAVGSSEQFWFTEFNANRIGRLRYFPPGPSPITFLGEIELPTPNSGPRDIVSSFGIAWVTEFNGNKIARVAGDGSVVEFPVPTPSSGPTGITRDGSGRIWFTEFIANKIGRLDPATGVITEFPIPTPNSGPLQIVVSGGDIWFTESNAGKVGRVRSDGSIVEYALPDVASFPYGISGDASGGAWFTERGSGRIGRVTPDGRVQEFALPTPASGPTGIFFYDPRIARPPVLLVAEAGVNRIARAVAGDYVAIVGAGNSGSWDTEIVFSNREDYPVEVTLGPYGGFPEQCFHATCGSPSVVIPARGTNTVSTGTILRAGANIETWYVSPHGFDLPTVKARAVNRANPFQSMDLPALRHSTIAGLNPSVLSFPGAARSPAGARSNLILSHVAGTREAITVRVEALSASGDVLGAESFVLDRPTATLFIADVLGQFGVSELQAGQIRVIKTAGAGLLWGILATATEEGSFSVTVGQNP